MRVLPIILLLLAGGAAQAEGPYQYPFQKPDLPMEQRIDNIISLLTLDEKIACLGTNPTVARLGIKGTGHVEGLHGLALGGPGGWGRPTPIPTTQFAQAIGMGETWDPDLIRKAGGVEGNETRYIYQSKHRGGLVVRAPNADLGRDPRWGRTEECFGEDPFFNGKMVAAMVKGLQGDDPKYWLTASLMKHFLANSNENGRGGSSSDFDERLLREYYSVPFRMGVQEGGSRAFMAAYNAWNHIPMTVNPILRGIAMKEWGVDGIICTDAGALRNMINLHKYYSTLSQGAAGSVKAGISQFLDRFRQPVEDALKEKLLTEADIDEVIKGEFRVMIRLGLLDPPERVPYSKLVGEEDAWKTPGHKEVARQVALESIVLLKNTNAFLPLDKTKLKSIAVIGPRADQVLLDWYSGTPPYTITPLEGIKAKLGPGITVNYAANNDNDAAVKAAKESDVAVVFVGNHTTCDAGWAKCPTPSDGKEAVDRRAINLEMEELVKQVYAANPKTVMVLVSSFPFAINWSQENLPAILHMTHNAQEMGTAIADTLFGDYNPGGRLVQTWPKSLDQVPPMMDYDIRHGRTYMYFKGDPLYPFGYGLSYTTFRYSKLKVNPGRLPANGAVTVSVDVKNTGTRRGDEVVELYVKHLKSAVDRPAKELRGFSRVTLDPNETKTVQIPLSAESLNYWDVGRKRWALEQDEVELMVGSSSADVKLTKTLRVASVTTAQGWNYIRVGNPNDLTTATKGGILFAGGGADVDEAFRWMCAKGNGGDFLIVRASGTDAYNPYVRDLCPALNSVSTLIVTSRAGAQDPFVKDTILKAEALFIAGGDQGNYVNFYGGTPVAAAIDQLAARGVPVGGTSAGNAVLAQFGYSALTGSVTSKQALANPYTPLITISNGFLNVSPLLRNTFTDDHFTARDRMGRLVAFLARVIQDGNAAQVSAIATDERTAYLMEPDGTGVVTGAGAAFFLRTTGPPDICRRDMPLTFKDLSVYRVKAGGTFNIASWTGIAGQAYTLSAISGVLQSTQRGDLQ